MAFDHASRTIPHPDGIEVNRHALDIILNFAFDACALILQFSLSSLLFGVLTVLSISSVFLLFRRRSLFDPSIRIPLLSTIILYTSTSIYMASLIWNWRSVIQIIRAANESIVSYGYDGDESLLTLERAVFKQSWMATVVLGLNVIIGDAVVWWRACVIWRHRTIYYTGPMLLLLTLGFGIAGALKSDVRLTQTIYFMFGNGGFADTAAALSLITNIVATSLIAIKAFFHHCRLKKYLGTYRTKTRVLKVFAMFIESGIIYCIILLVVLVYQFNPDTTGLLVDVEYYFVYGCLVPLVAIYPTSIVFLTALDWPAEEPVIVRFLLVLTDMQDYTPRQ